MNNKNLLILLAVLGGGALVFLLSKKQGQRMIVMPSLSGNPAKPNTTKVKKTAFHSPPRPQVGFPIQRGSRGPAVLQLQQALVSADQNPGPLDGVWGAQTSSALRDEMGSDAPIYSQGELDGIIAQMAS
ncbi:hypothetical protein BKI52_32995 [marine bacterium AO1-C]|nr:hypothetical protein BKI52_32995 [marine bacterium AO1-C]